MQPMPLTYSKRQEQITVEVQRRAADDCGMRVPVPADYAAAAASKGVAAARRRRRMVLRIVRPAARPAVVVARLAVDLHASAGCAAPGAIVGIARGGEVAGAIPRYTRTARRCHRAGAAVAGARVRSQHGVDEAAVIRGLAPNLTGRGGSVARRLRDGERSRFITRGHVKRP